MKTKFYISILVFTINASASSLEQAQSLANQYDCPGAIRISEKLITDNSVNDEALTVLVDCLYKTKQYSRVIETAQNYLKKHPLHLYGRMKLIQSLQIQNSFKEALDESALLTKIYPQNEQAISLHAEILSENKRQDEAFSVLEAYLDKNPKASLVGESLVKILLQRKEFKRAKKTMTEILREGPVTAASYILYAQSTLELNESEVAWEATKTALKLDPEDWRGYKLLADIFLQKNQPRQAIETLLSARDKVSKEHKDCILLALAEIQIKENLFDAAKANILAAQKLNPLSEKPHYLKAECHLLQGNPAAAVRALKDYLTINPKRNWAIMAIGRILSLTLGEKESRNWINSNLSVSENATELTAFLNKKKFSDEVRKLASVDKYCIVQVGDTLSKLAADHLGSKALWPQLYQLNRDALKTPHILSVGTKLKICGGDQCPSMP